MKLYLSHFQHSAEENLLMSDQYIVDRKSEKGEKLITQNNSKYVGMWLPT